MCDLVLHAQELPPEYNSGFFKHLDALKFFMTLLLTEVLILKNTLNIPHYNCLLNKKNALSLEKKSQ